MHRYQILLLIAILASAFCWQAPVFAQEDTTSIDLAGMAAFKPGDDPVWRSKYIDEEIEWTFIPVPGAWEDNGYPMLDGYGWYRIRFRIPSSLRNDSLVLVFSGIDDADETFFNGAMIGKSGHFPPNAQSELHSFRAYPIPPELKEEYNLIAVRVCDFGDKGGITGNIMRIVRVQDIPSVLDEIIREPYRAPLLYNSNGVCVSAYNPVTSTIEWMKPHIFTELDEGLRTESIMSSLTLSVALDGYVHRLKDYEIDYTEYYQNTGIIHTAFTAGFEVFWYHPSGMQERALVCMLRHPRGMNIDDVGALFTADKDYWQFRDYVQDFQSERRYYFLFVYNSCCDDLTLRDLKNIVGEEGKETFDKISLERELLAWKDMRVRQFVPPVTLNPQEQVVYAQSLSLLQMAQVREPGQGAGQIVSAFAPASRAYCIPREHFASVQALAAAGLIEEAARGMDFIDNAATGRFVFFDVYGTDFSTGLPYLVTPAKYFGNGKEYLWEKPENAVLSYDGMAMYIETIQCIQNASRELFKKEKSAFNDSLFVRKYWNNLSRLTADVLLHLRDEHGMIKHDGGPFGPGLELSPGVYTAIHAAAALHIAAGYAKLMHDDVRHSAYEEASVEIRRKLDSIIRYTASQVEATTLTIIEKNLFHPLLCDGVIWDVFHPRSIDARFAFDMMESSFSIEDAPNMYNARPDGDWFARQARPLLTLRLARAYIANKQLDRAEALFASITKLALENYGMTPEFVDPVTHNWYGGVPAIGYGAAEYILAAQEIHALREFGGEK